MTRMLRLAVLLGSVSLAACSGLKDTLGLTRREPDPFTVVSHAPLELPPDYVLLAPAPGTPRPQEQSTDKIAAAALLGKKQSTQSNTSLSKSESLLLKKTGGDTATPAIRAEVNNDAKNGVNDGRSTIQKLLNIQDTLKDPPSVLDPAAESARIKAENPDVAVPVPPERTPLN